jgi:hypothetical protein
MPFFDCEQPSFETNSLSNQNNPFKDDHIKFLGFGLDQGGVIYVDLSNLT